MPNRIDSVNHTSIGHAQTSSYLPDFLCFGASLSANESVGIPLGVALMEIATVDFETSGCVTSLLRNFALEREFDVRVGRLEIYRRRRINMG